MAYHAPVTHISQDIFYPALTVAEFGAQDASSSLAFDTSTTIPTLQRTQSVGLIIEKGASHTVTSFLLMSSSILITAGIYLTPYLVSASIRLTTSFAGTVMSKISDYGCRQLYAFCTNQNNKIARIRVKEVESPSFQPCSASPECVGPMEELRIDIREKAEDTDPDDHDLDTDEDADETTPLLHETRIPLKRTKSAPTLLSTERKIDVEQQQDTRNDDMPIDNACLLTLDEMVARISERHEVEFPEDTETESVATIATTTSRLSMASQMSVMEQFSMYELEQELPPLFQENEDDGYISTDDDDVMFGEWLYLCDDDDETSSEDESD